VDENINRQLMIESRPAVTGAKVEATPINLSQEPLAGARNNYPAVERFVLRDDASGRKSLDRVIATPFT